MSELFLDTVGLLALWDEDDQGHEATSVAFAQIRSKPARLFTTRFVLAECGNALARTEFRGVVAEIERALRHSGGLIDITPADWSVALDRYSASHIKTLSF